MSKNINYSSDDIFYGYKTIEIKNNVILGYDTTGKEYYIFDGRESRWEWYKDLTSARKFFDFYTKQK